MNIDDIHSFDNTSKLPYGSEITLNSVTHENVGYYYCVDEDYFILKKTDIDTMLKQKRASRIYLFVKGTHFQILLQN